MHDVTGLAAEYGVDDIALDAIARFIEQFPDQAHAAGAIRAGQVEPVRAFLAELAQSLDSAAD